MKNKYEFLGTEENVERQKDQKEAGGTVGM
jgi:hypothetical protein